MSKRDEFVATLAREYPQLSSTQIGSVAAQLMRLGRAYGRLQEAFCNGDYPADNGQRETRLCDQCGLAWATESFRGGVCPDCRTEAKIRTACAGLPGSEPIFSGDPRGATVKLKLPSGRTDDWGQVGVCVPNS